MYEVINLLFFFMSTYTILGRQERGLLYLQYRQCILAAFFTALTALGAFIRIPLPVVPLTLQVLMVLLSGFFLGPRWALLSQTAYILLGLAGVPVFAGGGGIYYVLAPTFGYLFSYLPAAWIVGKISSGGTPGLKRFTAASFTGIGVIYLVGVTVLFLNLNFLAGKSITFFQAVKMGAVPFLGPDLLKGTVAALFALKIQSIRHMREKSSAPLA